MKFRSEEKMRQIITEYMKKDEYADMPPLIDVHADMPPLIDEYADILFDCTKYGDYIL